MERGVEAERRDNERLPIRMLDDYGVSNDSEHRIVNISKSGCALETEEQLGEVDTTIAFALPLPGKVDNLTVDALIVWKHQASPRNGGDGSYRYGLAFRTMDEEEEAILEAYLDFLRRDVQIARLHNVGERLKVAREKLTVLLAYRERENVAYLH